MPLSEEYGRLSQEIGQAQERAIEQALAPIRDYLKDDACGADLLRFLSLTRPC